MLLNCLSVGVGGFIGSIARYLISQIPFGKTDYPIHTFITNIIGAILIGIIFARAGQPGWDPRKTLMLKTGLCGGLTTFSTFSQETFVLFQEGNYVLGALYIILSITLCVLGVALGMYLGARTA